MVLRGGVVGRKEGYLRTRERVGVGVGVGEDGRAEGGWNFLGGGVGLGDWIMGITYTED